MNRIAADTNLFVAAGFNPESDSARILEAVQAGTLRLVWDEATRRETEHIVGSIPPLRGTDLSAYFRSDTRYDGRTDTNAFGFIPDPADRKFAALAAATGVVLVTSDRHLLDGRPHPAWKSSPRPSSPSGPAGGTAGLRTDRRRICSRSRTEHQKRFLEQPTGLLRRAGSAMTLSTPSAD